MAAMPDVRGIAEVDRLCDRILGGRRYHLSDVEALIMAQAESLRKTRDERDYLLFLVAAMIERETLDPNLKISAACKSDPTPQAVLDYIRRKSSWLQS